MTTRNGEHYLFKIHAFLQGQVHHAAYFALEIAPNGNTKFVELQYTPEYQALSCAIPLLPTLPVTSDRYTFTCTGDGVPGFIEELLPDSWGRVLIARTLRNKGVSRNPTIADLLSIPSGSYLGCFTCTTRDQLANPPLPGLHLVDAAATIKAAKRVDRLQGTEEDFERLRVAGASSPGGARPKFLAYDDDGYWLAKLERDSDRYNVLMAEHTALEIARNAGLHAPVSKVVNVEDERMLLVERFDLDAQSNRLNSFTANAILKDSHSQQDIMFGSYESIAGLIKRYSHRPREDLYQLLGQALLNKVVRNTDDHLRNFSFIGDNSGFCLSPAYDIVPTPTVGAYHQLGWGRGSFLPELSNAESAARHLGLPGALGKELGERLAESIKAHAPALRDAGALPDGGFWT